MPAEPLEALARGARTGPWQPLGIALAVALAYANSLDVPFLFDDPSPGVPLDYATRPLVAATFELNRAWSGFSTWSYHVVNVLVHLACALLLLGVLRRASAAAAPKVDAAARARLAFAVSLLWAVHPLQTSAVTYLSQRAEALGTLCYLAYLYAFLRAHPSARPARWLALALAALALGLAAKEIVATAPVVAFLFDLLFVQRRSPTLSGVLQALHFRAWFHGAVALVTLALALLFVLPAFTEDETMGLGLQGMSALDYARTQPGVLLHYLKLVVWPQPLCFDYGWPIAREPSRWLPQSLVVATLLGASVALALRRPDAPGRWAGFLGLAFFAVLAPTSSVVPIQDAAFEHRMYLALAAPLTLLVALAGRACARRAPLARGLPGGLLAAAALACLAGTVRRNQDYRAPVVLLEKTVALAPHHARAHLTLGTELIEAGRIAAGIEALHAGLRLDPSNAYGYLNLGKAYLMQDEPARALPLLERAAELVDEDPRIADTLGGALFLSGQPARALPHFERALAANPGFAPTHQRFALALEAVGRTDEAVRHFEEAVRLAPELAEPRHQLATLLLGLGRAAEALAQAEAACARDPAGPAGFFVRAQALRALGRPAEALVALRTTLALAPELPEPHAEFAQTVARLPGASEAERREALQHAERANELTGGTRPELLLIQAEAEAGLGEHARALASLDRALALPADSRTPALAEALRARRADYARLSVPR